MSTLFTNTHGVLFGFMQKIYQETVQGEKIGGGGSEVNYQNKCVNLNRKAYVIIKAGHVVLLSLLL